MSAQHKTPPRVLSIAGSDSSGGAGIQADIKTITMLGGYAMSAITAVTAQNSLGVQAIEPMPPEFVGEQIRSCIGDIGVDAIKIGMLHNAKIVEAVAAEASKLADTIPVILDPVMVATSGAQLIDDEAIEAMRERLFPLATMLTPNMPELIQLTRAEPATTKDVDDVSAALGAQYDCYVLAKGGHTQDNQIVDVLAGKGEPGAAFSNARIETEHTHGTGCTLSSAIAVLMGHGLSAADAVKVGRRFVYQAIKHAPGFGGGNGPLGHQAVRSP